MFDTAIIGTGPAGLSAAITLKIRGKNIVWFGSKRLSGKVEKSEKIANYPGLGIISGKELDERFMSHVSELGIEITDRMVTQISRLKDRFMLLADNEIYEAKTVLLATGVVTTKALAGEERLLGRGVSYCATCDGMFYKGKTIAVLCGDKRYEHEVTYLSEMAGRVYLYAPYKDIGVRADNIELLPSPIVEIKGEKRAEAITLANGNEIPVDGFFCLRSAIAPSTLLGGLEMDGSHIVTDRQMKTNIEGCFAAGDCTGRPYQIAKAIGEGNIAAHAILDALA